VATFRLTSVFPAPGHARHEDDRLPPPLEGHAGELLAVRRLDVSKVLVVASREVEARDGFVITAFMTSRVAALFKGRRQRWPSSN